MKHLRGFQVVSLLVVVMLFAAAAFYSISTMQRLPQSMITPAAAEAATGAASAPEDEPVESKLTPEQIAEVKTKLTAEQYNVCFLAGTEPPGSGKYEKVFDPGAYHCAVCGEELFKSETKYDSHSGWPAFWDTAGPEKLELLTDDSLGHRRTEVRCQKCGAHLGHVFEDGPKPTGLRYCINSVALEFVPDKQ